MRYLSRRRLLAWLAGAVVLLVVVGSVAWGLVARGRVPGPRVITAGLGPSGVALPRDGQVLYVADYGAGQNNSAAGDNVTPVSLRTGRALPSRWGGSPSG